MQLRSLVGDSGYFRAFSAQGRTGQVVPLEDAGAAAEAIAQVLKNPGRRDAMARAARKVAVESYSIRREADGIEAVYQALWG